MTGLGHDLRYARPAGPAQSGLRGRCLPDAGPRHRGDDHGLQLRGRGPPPAAAVPRAVAPVRAVERARRQAARDALLSQLRGLPRRRQRVRARRDLPTPAVQRGNLRRSGAGPGRLRVGELLPDSRSDAARSAATSARARTRRVGTRWRWSAIGYWRRQLGADPAAVGRTLRVDGETLTLIGVVPAGLALPGGRGHLDSHLPRGQVAAGEPRPSGVHGHRSPCRRRLPGACAAADGDLGGAPRRRVSGAQPGLDYPHGAAAGRAGGRPSPHSSPPVRIRRHPAAHHRR